MSSALGSVNKAHRAAGDVNKAHSAPEDVNNAQRVPFKIAKIQNSNNVQISKLENSKIQRLKLTHRCKTPAKKTRTTQIRNLEQDGGPATPTMADSARVLQAGQKKKEEITPSVPEMTMLGNTAPLNVKQTQT